jgi:CYTH domain-containing protein
MPIEHEHKFVLTPSQDLFDRVTKHHHYYLISQFYISDAARYREMRPQSSSLFGAEWFFTHKFAFGKDVLEHEMNVDHDDFLLAKTGSLGTLYKTRCKIASNGVHWDVDFFLDGPHDRGKLIFAMAECEHPRGTAYEILPIIADSVVYRVPEAEAAAFSNRKLTSLDYIWSLRLRFNL